MISASDTSHAGERENSIEIRDSEIRDLPSSNIAIETFADSIAKTQHIGGI
jgi:hypothetical protein